MKENHIFGCTPHSSRLTPASTPNLKMLEENIFVYCLKSQRRLPPPATPYSNREREEEDKEEEWPYYKNLSRKLSLPSTAHSLDSGKKERRS